jgi:hypothetical protein
VMLSSHRLWPISFSFWVPFIGPSLSPARYLHGRDEFAYPGRDNRPMSHSGAVVGS